MAFFNWGPEFEVGIMQIDAQHKRLAELVNEMFEAMTQGHGREVLGRILNDLSSYAVTHFKTEEELMQKHGFPGFAEHKAKHDSMTRKVVALKQEHETGKSAVITNKVGKFLRDWLTKHIQGTDKQYAAFLRGKGVR